MLQAAESLSDGQKTVVQFFLAPAFSLQFVSDGNDAVTVIFDFLNESFISMEL